MSDITCDDADTLVKCAICERKSPPEIMKKFTGGFVHFLCDERERLLADNGPWQAGADR